MTTLPVIQKRVRIVAFFCGAPNPAAGPVKNKTRTARHQAVRAGAQRGRAAYLRSLASALNQFSSAVAAWFFSENW